jgi:YfiH family protein
MTLSFIRPNWPVPPHIHAFCTTRAGGNSLAPYDSFNLANHVDDNPQHVERNRQLLTQTAKLPESPRWLTQHHSIDVVNSRDWIKDMPADGLFSAEKNHVCVAMTADCLPVLICDTKGTQVAAVHAGWRGLADGILEQAIEQFTGEKRELLIWLGPAIGPTHFEVGQDVVSAFTAHLLEAESAFKQIDNGQFMADIYSLARQRLNALGVDAIYGGDYCTADDPDQFFSYRRDQVTGRMASLIWIAPS